MARERGGKSGRSGGRLTPDQRSGEAERTEGRDEARAHAHDLDVPEDEHADDEAAKGGERGPALGELLRKAVAAGLTSVFGPTEAVRRAVGEAMPRDWIDFATEQSDRTRSQFLERLAAELARTLESMDLVQVAERVLEGRTIEVRANIRLAPREPGKRGERGPLRFLVVDGDEKE
jgi:hypothetical protein